MDIYNGGPLPRCYQMYNTGTGEELGGVFCVEPGKHYSWDYSGPEKIPIGVVPKMIDPLTGDWMSVGTGGISIPTSSPYWEQTGGEPSGTHSDGTTGTDSPYVDVQGPGGTNWLHIGWPDSPTDLAKDVTLRTGLDVIYSTLQEGAFQRR